MRQALLAIFMLVALVGTEALERPEPPEPQPDDNLTFEITVGEARKALWYADQFEVFFRAAQALEADALAKADLIVALEARIARLSFQRTVAVGAAAFAAAVIVGILLVR